MTAAAMLNGLRLPMLTRAFIKRNAFIIIKSTISIIKIYRYAEYDQRICHPSIAWIMGMCTARVFIGKNKNEII